MHAYALPRAPRRMTMKTVHRPMDGVFMVKGGEGRAHTPAIARSQGPKEAGAAAEEGAGERQHGALRPSLCLCCVQWKFGSREIWLVQY